MVNKQSTTIGNSVELFDYPTRFHALFPAKKMYIAHKIWRKKGALQKFKAIKMMIINDNNNDLTLDSCANSAKWSHFKNDSK